LPVRFHLRDDLRLGDVEIPVEEKEELSLHEVDFG
jgi:hypothetical protein